MRDYIRKSYYISNYNWFFPVIFVDTFMRCVVPKRHNKKTKDIVDNLIQQMIYQKDHDLSSLADVPLHIEGNQFF